MSDLLTVLDQRGLVHDRTSGLAERLGRGPITGYCGFDATADSLHVGNLVPIMGLAWLQRTGGRPIALLGAGTTMVGDPSGKRAERPVLDVETIDRNTTRLRAQLSRFLSFDGPGAALMRNNAEWLRPLGLMEFLRDTGKHFTIGYMLQKESVKSRLETGISFTEFAYMLVQAYDYEHLYRTEGCELQLGGSDQWGNITAGVELVGRKHGAEVHGVTLPLLTTAGGDKFGKSEGENIWLDPERTSPYRFHQFWINQDDRDMPRLLRTFTFLRVEEIAQVLNEHGANPGRRLAQRRLADEVTERVHGAEELARVRQAGETLFSGEEIPVDLLLETTSHMPEIEISGAEFGDGMLLSDLLVRAGLASSKADARRGIAGRGYYVNGVQVGADDATRRIGPGDLQRARGAQFVLLRKGKRQYVRIMVT